MLEVVAVSLAAPLVLVVVLVSCLGCLRKKEGFKTFQNEGFRTESQINPGFNMETEEAAVQNQNSESTVIQIEPLPELIAETTPRKPKIACVEKSKQESTFKDVVINNPHPFPRRQLKYLNEIGSGWFGQVLESDAQYILTGIPQSLVVAKMLRDDASNAEKKLFLEDVVPYRELEHGNVLRLLGQCTETMPYLMILEHAAQGDLKTYLRKNKAKSESLASNYQLVKFAIDAASGLACLHRHGYIHQDFAARCCQVMSDFTLKVGDYGIAEDVYKEDYYDTGKEILPVRWMSPESLSQQSGIWQTAVITRESNLWSFGVLLWEILMFGNQPYSNMSNEEVLQNVIADRMVKLSEPDINIQFKDRIVEVMQFCWLNPGERPNVEEAHTLLQRLHAIVTGSQQKEDNFEKKWSQLIPQEARIVSARPTPKPRPAAGGLESPPTEEPKLNTSFGSDLMSVKVEKTLPSAQVIDMSVPTEKPAQLAGVTDELIPASEEQKPSLLSITPLTDPQELTEGTKEQTPDASLVPTLQPKLPSHMTSTPVNTETHSKLNEGIKKQTPDASLVPTLQQKLPSHMTSTPVNAEPKGVEISNTTKSLNPPLEGETTASSRSATALTVSETEKKSGSRTSRKIEDDFEKIAVSVSEASLNSEKMASPLVVDLNDKVDPDKIVAQKDIDLLDGLDQQDKEIGVDLLQSSKQPSNLYNENIDTRKSPEVLSDDIVLVDDKDTELVDKITEENLEKQEQMTSSQEQTSTDVSPDLLSGSKNLLLADSDSSTSAKSPVSEVDNKELDVGKQLTFETNKESARKEFDTQFVHANVGLVSVANVDTVVDSKMSGLEPNTFRGMNSLFPSHDKELEVATIGTSNGKSLDLALENGLSGYETHSVDPSKSDSQEENTTSGTESSSDSAVCISSPELADAPSSFDEVAPPSDQVGSCVDVMSAEDDDDIDDDLEDEDDLNEDDLDNDYKSNSGDSDVSTDSSNSGQSYDCILDDHKPSVHNLEQQTSVPVTDLDEDQEPYVQVTDLDAEDEDDDYDHGFQIIDENSDECFDSDEDADLRFASELYLSRGVSSSQIFERPPLETIQEDVLPSPSDTSSVDLRHDSNFDEVFSTNQDFFEWDDFEGISIVGRDRTSASPKVSFEMSDWVLEGDSLSIRSNSSTTQSPHGSLGADIPGTPESSLRLSSTSEVKRRGRTSRSYVSDLMTNRSINTSVTNTNHSRTPFYSLYDNMDMDSDSDSNASPEPKPHGEYHLAEPDSSRMHENEDELASGSQTDDSVYMQETHLVTDTETSPAFVLESGLLSSEEKSFARTDGSNNGYEDDGSKTINERKDDRNSDVISEDCRLQGEILLGSEGGQGHVKVKEKLGSDNIESAFAQLASQHAIGLDMFGEAEETVNENENYNDFTLDTFGKSSDIDLFDDFPSTDNTTKSENVPSVAAFFTGIDIPEIDTSVDTSKPINLLDEVSTQSTALSASQGITEHYKPETTVPAESESSEQVFSIIPSMTSESLQPETTSASHLSAEESNTREEPDIQSFKDENIYAGDETLLQDNVGHDKSGISAIEHAGNEDLNVHEESASEEQQLARGYELEVEAQPSLVEKQIVEDKEQLVLVPLRDDSAINEEQVVALKVAAIKELEVEKELKTDEPQVTKEIKVVEDEQLMPEYPRFKEQPAAEDELIIDDNELEIGQEPKIVIEQSAADAQPADVDQLEKREGLEEKPSVEEQAFAEQLELAKEQSAIDGKPAFEEWSETVPEQCANDPEAEVQEQPVADEAHPKTDQEAVVEEQQPEAIKELFVKQSASVDEAVDEKQAVITVKQLATDEKSKFEEQSEMDKQPIVKEKAAANEELEFEEQSDEEKVIQEKASIDQTSTAEKLLPNNQESADVLEPTADGEWSSAEKQSTSEELQETPDSVQLSLPATLDSFDLIPKPQSFGYVSGDSETFDLSSPGEGDPHAFDTQMPHNLLQSSEESHATSASFDKSRATQFSENAGAISEHVGVTESDKTQELHNLPRLSSYDLDLSDLTQPDDSLDKNTVSQMPPALNDFELIGDIGKESQDQQPAKSSELNSLIQTSVQDVNNLDLIGDQTQDSQGETQAAGDHINLTDVNNLDLTGKVNQDSQDLSQSFGLDLHDTTWTNVSDTQEHDLAAAGEGFDADELSRQSLAKPDISSVDFTAETIDLTDTTKQSAVDLSQESQNVPRTPSESFDKNDLTQTSAVVSDACGLDMVAGLDQESYDVAESPDHITDLAQKPIAVLTMDSFDLIDDVGQEFQDSTQLDAESFDKNEVPQVQAVVSDLNSFDLIGGSTQMLQDFSEPSTDTFDIIEMPSKESPMADMNSFDLISDQHEEPQPSNDNTDIIDTDTIDLIDAQTEESPNVAESSTENSEAQESGKTDMTGRIGHEAVGDSICISDLSKIPANVSEMDSCQVIGSDIQESQNATQISDGLDDRTQQFKAQDLIQPLDNALDTDMNNSNVVGDQAEELNDLSDSFDIKDLTQTDNLSQETTRLMSVVDGFELIGEHTRESQDAAEQSADNLKLIDSNVSDVNNYELIENMTQDVMHPSVDDLQEPKPLVTDLNSFDLIGDQNKNSQDGTQPSSDSLGVNTYMDLTQTTVSSDIENSNLFGDTTQSEHLFQTSVNNIDGNFLTQQPEDVGLIVDGTQEAQDSAQPWAKPFEFSDTTQECTVTEVNRLSNQTQGAEDETHPLNDLIQTQTDMPEAENINLIGDQTQNSGASKESTTRGIDKNVSDVKSFDLVADAGQESQNLTEKLADDLNETIPTPTVSEINNIDLAIPQESQITTQSVADSFETYGLSQQPADASRIDSFDLVDNTSQGSQDLVQPSKDSLDELTQIAEDSVADMKLFDLSGEQTQISLDLKDSSDTFDINDQTQEPSVLKLNSFELIGDPREESQKVEQPSDSLGMDNSAQQSTEEVDTFDLKGDSMQKTLDLAQPDSQDITQPSSESLGKDDSTQHPPEMSEMNIFDLTSDTTHESQDIAPDEVNPLQLTGDLIQESQDIAQPSLDIFGKDDSTKQSVGSEMNDKIGHIAEDSKEMEQSSSNTSEKDDLAQQSVVSEMNAFDLVDNMMQESQELTFTTPDTFTKDDLRQQSDTFDLIGDVPQESQEVIQPPLDTFGMDDSTQLSNSVSEMTGDVPQELQEVIQPSLDISGTDDSTKQSDAVSEMTSDVPQESREVIQPSFDISGRDVSTQQSDTFDLTGDVPQESQDIIQPSLNTFGMADSTQQSDTFDLIGDVPMESQEVIQPSLDISGMDDSTQLSDYVPETTSDVPQESQEVIQPSLDMSGRDDSTQQSDTFDLIGHVPQESQDVIQPSLDIFGRDDSTQQSDTVDLIGDVQQESQEVIQPSFDISGSDDSTQQSDIMIGDVPKESQEVIQPYPDNFDKDDLTQHSDTVDLIGDVPQQAQDITLPSLDISGMDDSTQQSGAVSEMRMFDLVDNMTQESHDVEQLSLADTFVLIGDVRQDSQENLQPPLDIFGTDDAAQRSEMNTFDLVGNMTPKSKDIAQPSLDISGTDDSTKQSDAVSEMTSDVPQESREVIQPSFDISGRDVSTQQSDTFDLTGDVPQESQDIIQPSLNTFGMADSTQQSDTFDLIGDVPMESQEVIQPSLDISGMDDSTQLSDYVPETTSDVPQESQEVIQPSLDMSGRDDSTQQSDTFDLIGHVPQESQDVIQPSLDIFGRDDSTQQSDTVDLIGDVQQESQEVRQPSFDISGSDDSTQQSDIMIGDVPKESQEVIQPYPDNFDKDDLTQHSDTVDLIGDVPQQAQDITLPSLDISGMDDSTQQSGAVSEMRMFDLVDNMTQESHDVEQPSLADTFVQIGDVRQDSQENLQPPLDIFGTDDAAQRSEMNTFDLVGNMTPKSKDIAQPSVDIFGTDDSIQQFDTSDLNGDVPQGSQEEKQPSLDISGMDDSTQQSDNVHMIGDVPQESQEITQPSLYSSNKDDSTQQSDVVSEMNVFDKIGFVAEDSKEITQPSSISSKKNDLTEKSVVSEMKAFDKVGNMIQESQEITEVSLDIFGMDDSRPQSNTFDLIGDVPQETQELTQLSFDSAGMDDSTQQSDVVSEMIDNVPQQTQEMTQPSLDISGMDDSTQQSGVVSEMIDDVPQESQEVAQPSLHIFDTDDSAQQSDTVDLIGDVPQETSDITQLSLDISGMDDSTQQSDVVSEIIGDVPQETQEVIQQSFDISGKDDSTQQSETVDLIGDVPPESQEVTQPALDIFGTDDSAQQSEMKTFDLVGNVTPKSQDIAQPFVDFFGTDHSTQQFYTSDVIGDVPQESQEVIQPSIDISGTDDSAQQSDTFTLIGDVPQETKELKQQSPDTSSMDDLTQQSDVVSEMIGEVPQESHEVTQPSFDTFGTDSTQHSDTVDLIGDLPQKSQEITQPSLDISCTDDSTQQSGVVSEMIDDVPQESQEVAQPSLEIFDTDDSAQQSYTVDLIGDVPQETQDITQLSLNISGMDDSTQQSDTFDLIGDAPQDTQEVTQQSFDIFGKDDSTQQSDTFDLIGDVPRESQEVAQPSLDIFCTNDSAQQSAMKTFDPVGNMTPKSQDIAQPSVDIFGTGHLTQQFDTSDVIGDVPQESQKVIQPSIDISGTDDSAQQSDNFALIGDVPQETKELKQPSPDTSSMDDLTQQSDVVSEMIGEVPQESQQVIQPSLDMFGTDSTHQSDTVDLIGDLPQESQEITQPSLNIFVEAGSTQQSVESESNIFDKIGNIAVDSGEVTQSSSDSSVKDDLTQQSVVSEMNALDPVGTMPQKSQEVTEPTPDIFGTDDSTQQSDTFDLIGDVPQESREVIQPSLEIFGTDNSTQQSDAVSEMTDDVPQESQEVIQPSFDISSRDDSTQQSDTVDLIGDVPQESKEVIQPSLEIFGMDDSTQQSNALSKMTDDVPQESQEVIQQSIDIFGKDDSTQQSDSFDLIGDVYQESQDVIQSSLDISGTDDSTQQSDTVDLIDDVPQESQIVTQPSLDIFGTDDSTQQSEMNTFDLVGNMTPKSQDIAQSSLDIFGTDGSTQQPDTFALIGGVPEGSQGVKQPSIDIFGENDSAQVSADTLEVNAFDLIGDKTKESRDVTQPTSDIFDKGDSTTQSVCLPENNVFANMTQDSQDVAQPSDNFDRDSLTEQSADSHKENTFDLIGDMTQESQDVTHSSAIEPTLTTLSTDTTDTFRSEDHPTYDQTQSSTDGFDMNNDDLLGALGNSVDTDLTENPPSNTAVSDILTAFGSPQKPADENEFDNLDLGSSGKKETSDLIQASAVLDNSELYQSSEEDPSGTVMSISDDANMDDSSFFSLSDNTGDGDAVHQHAHSQETSNASLLDENVLAESFQTSWNESSVSNSYLPDKRDAGPETRAETLIPTNSLLTLGETETSIASSGGADSDIGGMLLDFSSLSPAGDSCQQADSNISQGESALDESSQTQNTNQTQSMLLDFM